MTLPASGPLSLSQIQTEMGGSNPISLSEYYRNGGIVRSTYPDGTGSINSNVPTSGAISLTNFYNGQGVFVASFNITSNYGNFNLNTVLTNSYGWDGVKPVDVTVTVNAGVTVYGYGYGGAAGLTVGSLPSGSYVNITNNGIIAGYGGYGAGTAGAGGDGGVALNISAPTNLINNNAILGGGGGGGGGGAGPEYGTSKDGGNGGAGGDAILRYANLLLTNNGIIGAGGGGGGGGASVSYDSVVYEGGGGGAGGRTGTQIVPSYGGAQGGSVYYTNWTRYQDPTAGANGLTDYAGISIYDIWNPATTGGAPLPGHGGGVYPPVLVYGAYGGRGGSVSYTDQQPWASNGFPGQGGSGGSVATQGVGGNAGRAINAYGGTLAVVTYGTIWGSYA
jgi:hypothetical protein